jgi:hypothetical protein
VLRVPDLRVAAKRLEVRQRELGQGDVPVAVARNEDRARSPAQQQLLGTIADEARRQGRAPPPFGGDG